MKITLHFRHSETKNVLKYKRDCKTNQSILRSHPRLSMMHSHQNVGAIRKLWNPDPRRPVLVARLASKTSTTMYHPHLSSFHRPTSHQTADGGTNQTKKGLHLQ